MHDELGRFERVVFDVSPRLVADGSVRLPDERTNLAKLSAFQIEHSGMLLHCVVLVVDHSDVVPIFQGTVVVPSLCTEFEQMERC